MTTCDEESRPVEPSLREAMRELFCWHRWTEWRSMGRYVFPWGNHPGFIRHVRNCEKCNKHVIKHEVCVP